jgi:hypothetical protein
MTKTRGLLQPNTRRGGRVEFFNTIGGKLKFIAPIASGRFGAGN